MELHRLLNNEEPEIQPQPADQQTTNTTKTPRVQAGQRTTYTTKTPRVQPSLPTDCFGFYGKFAVDHKRRKKVGCQIGTCFAVSELFTSI